MRKILMLGVMVLSFAILSACGSGAGDAGGGATAPATAPAGGTAPAATDPDSPFAGGFSLPIGGGGHTFSFASLEGWFPAVSINDNLPIWQEIEAITGVSIQWEAISDYETAMAPRIAAGQALPDLFIVPPTWGNSGVFRLASQGMLTRLDTMMPLHAPDIYNILNQYPELRGMKTAPNGHIYTIADTPMFVNDVVVPNALFIRQDWLDNLGLPMPVTLDDWHRTLVAFRDDDPNGNGINDEIPFSGIGIRGAITVFGGAFGLPVGVGNWWYDDNGQVFSIFTSPYFRNFLATMADWYSQGLIDMEINRDEANFQSLVSTNVVGSFVHLAERETQYDSLLLAGGVYNVQHALVVPPSAVHPLRMTKRTPTWNHYAIPSTSPNAELVLQWVNFVWGTDEGVGLTEWGIEGKTYTWEGGQRRFTDFVLNNPDGLDPYNALRSLGAANTILVRTPRDVYAALNEGNNAVAYANLLANAMVEPFPNVMPTEEEQAILDRIGPDFNTYVEENIILFLMGVNSMDQYDDFLNTLHAIGLDELVAVRQAHFDRSGLMG